MARKSKEETTTKPLDSFGIIKKMIEDSYGAGILVNGTSFLDDTQQIISVSPAVDMMLGGGIPEGSWVNIIGKPKTGKTSETLQILKKAQKMGKKCYYLNIEGRLKKMNMEGCKGLNIEDLFVIQSTPEKILSAQDYLNMAENILKLTTGAVVVFDSIAALAPTGLLSEGVGKSMMGKTQQLISQFTATMGQLVPVKKHIIISIQKVMANISGYGAKYIAKGGNDITYQGDIIMNVKKTEDWKEGERIIGQTTEWDVDCTALGAFPGSKCTSYLRYGVGIDETSELIDIGKDLGLITGTGWLTLDFLQNYLEDIEEKKWDDDTKAKYKIQGMAQMKGYLEENDKIAKLLHKEILEISKQS